MGNQKIKFANRKAKKELRRTRKKQRLDIHRSNTKISQRRARKMLKEGREEHRKKRKAQRDYVSGLEAEIDG